MARVKIKFPDEKPLYHCTIPVRIGDINYGGHAGNDSLLSIIHEARVQMLAHWGWTELDAGGNSLIMADVMIAYRGEAFYGEVLHVTLFADEVTTQSFNLLYKITTAKDGQTREILHAKTGIVCFDYNTRKIVRMEHQLRERLNNATT